MVAGFSPPAPRESSSQGEEKFVLECLNWPSPFNFKDFIKFDLRGIVETLAKEAQPGPRGYIDIVLLGCNGSFECVEDHNLQREVQSKWNKLLKEGQQALQRQRGPPEVQGRAQAAVGVSEDERESVTRRSRRPKKRTKPN